MSDRLFEHVDSQLRKIAQEQLVAERRGHTLEATALVYKVWLRLGGDKPVAWGERAQFSVAAVEAMRRILIDRRTGTAPATQRIASPP